MDSDDGDSWELGNGEERLNRGLQRVRNNDPRAKSLYCYGDYNVIQNMTNEEWEDLGRDISNNTHLLELEITEGAFDGAHISSLFRGLTRSSSIIKLDLRENDINAVELRSLEPFLNNSTNLQRLDVSKNDIQTEGFSNLWQALHDSPIESLRCSRCGITSIEIENAPKYLRELILDDNNIRSEGFDRLLRSLRDSSVEDLCCWNCGIESIDIYTNSFHRGLKTLNLNSNRITSNGCSGIAKLLREGDTMLQILNLGRNLIGDEGVATLVDALKTNTSLKELYLEGNGISDIGRIMMLKLLNDISSITATLQSNHTLELETVYFGAMNDDIDHYTEMALSSNRDYPLFKAGREKVIETQLHSQRRAKLAGIQGVRSQSVYGEIDPLHLPEVLSLVSRRHGQEELYVALKSSIDELIPIMSREQCIMKQLSHYAARTEDLRAKMDCIRQQLAFATERSNELNTELEGIKAARVDEDRPHSNKRLRLD